MIKLFFCLLLTKMCVQQHHKNQRRDEFVDRSVTFYLFRVTDKIVLFFLQYLL